ncbi:DUF1488 family protein [Caballeronia zhejiangensis]|uniref:DUF1488 family protein n=1 Tax=Caballeronia zhejiangensis TaxID=871203 RepID=UPI00158F4886|nr:DUF1488 family protein [Caballeronia zhejiangensis]
MLTNRFEPRLLDNRRGVAFFLERSSGQVECVISLEALEAHFWLPQGADEAKVLKHFCDGYRRIQAIAERKSLIRPTGTLQLNPHDFDRT